MYSARVHPPTTLHGYGLRWDPAARVYRVRNELTGEWLRDPSGELAGFPTLSAAASAWRTFESRRRAA
ncbi:hypothetical protein ACFVHB_14250 [Kitasatospora sp. NPDC127111]|uniref:hypothetical protein n=1 Tax=Kitasatospora sp. NPDC127111 TaxID=3345363 RepID=UPI00363AB074